MTVKEHVNKRISIDIGKKDEHRITWDTDSPNNIRMAGDSNYYRIDVGDINELIAGLEKIQKIVEEHATT